MSASRGDEGLRSLEREVAASGSREARLRLATELERRGRGGEAVALLFETLAVFPQDADVRRQLGRFRGPARGPWGAPNADAKNTRLSPARGPRGHGAIVREELIAPPEEAAATDEEGKKPQSIPAPLLAGGGRPYASLSSRRILALTADGHAVTESRGAGGIHWFLAEHGGTTAWKHRFPNVENPPDFERFSFAVISQDGTVHGATGQRKLIAIDVGGELRFAKDLPSPVLSLALDDERERLYLVYEYPPALSCRDARTGLEVYEPVPLGSLAGIADEAIVCKEGLVACVSVHGHVGIVSLDGKLVRDLRYGERIGGASGGLAPWGDIVVVSFDSSGAYVATFDAKTGKNQGGFEALECQRATPAIDREGTIYLDGGALGYVRGFDLVSGSERYRLDRRSERRAPESPGSGIALGEGEVLFIELSRDGVKLVRGGGDPEAGSGATALRDV